jgi:hypothetical protein
VNVSQAKTHFSKLLAGLIDLDSGGDSPATKAEVAEMLVEGPIPPEDR